MLDAKWLESEVIAPALKELKLYSLNAAKLLLYTAGHESLMGKYTRQVGGPALSIYQIEPYTFHDVCNRRKKFLAMTGYDPLPAAETMVRDNRLATIVCRLKYLDAPEKLPDANDLLAIAKYWKKYYNSFKGKGTVEKFMEDNREYFNGGIV